MNDENDTPATPTAPPWETFTVSLAPHQAGLLRSYAGRADMSLEDTLTWLLGLGLGTALRYEHEAKAEARSPHGGESTPQTARDASSVARRQ
jgi:hypothetical protein